MQWVNLFLVSELDGTIHVPHLSPRRLSRDEALNLAAWLVAIADEPVAFDQVTAQVSSIDDPNVLAECVLSVELVQVIAKAQREATR